MIMKIEEAREWVAQCWCSEENKTKVMDVDLAESFAQLLMARVNEAIESKKIRKARRTMRQAFKDDPSFKQAYIANVAELLVDRDMGNKAAEEILDLIFGN